jgi:ABC-type antimicrobial peptide transport system permease subunit
MILENFRLAFSSLTSNKLRTLLSLLGIVIGVASVIAITSLGASATQSITNAIAAAGLETITVFPSGNSREVRDQFTEELGQALERFIPGVARVLPHHTQTVQLRAGTDTWRGNASAVLSDHATVLNYQLAQGRFISQEDLDGRRSVLVLGATVANDLFPESDPVGQRIRLIAGNQVRAFEIIGVMAEKSAGFGLNFDTSVYMPYTTFTQRFTRTTTVGSYIVRVRAGADPMAVSTGITDYLNTILGRNNFRVLSPATIAETATQVTGTLSIFLAGIAAISLLVGGIGIMNIMLVAVVERTREIGIRKALGARPNLILGQFLIEAGVLTSIGGFIGLGVGLGISNIATRFINYELVVDTSAVILALGVSTAIGIFFGLYPAFRASRLDPIKALSYE